MHLSCIDLVYIHNAFESWYEDISREEFMHMLSKVFEVYEEYRSVTKSSITEWQPGLVLEYIQTTGNIYH